MIIKKTFENLCSSMFDQNNDVYVNENKTAFFNNEYISTSGKVDVFATYNVDLNDRKFILHLSLKLEAKLNQNFADKVVRIKGMELLGFIVHCAFEDKIPLDFLGFEDNVYDVYNDKSELPNEVKNILDEVLCPLEEKAKILLLKKFIDTKDFQIFDKKQLMIKDMIIEEKHDISVDLKYDHEEWLEYTNFFNPKLPKNYSLNTVVINNKDN